MRALTFHEKISIKGRLAQKGLHAPRLDMSQALCLWSAAFGFYPIKNYHLMRQPRGRLPIPPIPTGTPVRMGNNSGIVLRDEGVWGITVKTEYGSRYYNRKFVQIIA